MGGRGGLVLLNFHLAYCLDGVGSLCTHCPGLPQSGRRSVLVGVSRPDWDNEAARLAHSAMVILWLSLMAMRDIKELVIEPEDDTGVVKSVELS
jgi:hypothetical protein